MNISSVLLLGTENILALTVIRALGSLMPEVKIYTFSPQYRHKSISERSKFIHSRKYFHSWDDEDFTVQLKQMIRESQADIVLPVSNDSVRKLASVKDDVKELVHLPPLPSAELYDQLESKDELANLILKYQLPYTNTQRLDETDVDSLRDDEFPLMLKPISGSSGTGIALFKEKKSLLPLVRYIDKTKYILQEYIPGQDYGSSILSIDGEIKAYTIQKVLANKNFGVATALKFIHDDQILRITRELLKKTGYSGVAHLDFRMDERTGEAKLIDFNARFWFSLMGSRAAGVDFVFLSCLAAAGIPFEKPDYHCITYFIGKNTFEYYLKKTLQLKPHLGSTTEQIIHTDIWDRIRDPLPEIARYVG